MYHNVHIDETLCNCCGDCLQSCIFSTEIFKRDSDRLAIIDAVLCDGCAECVTLFTCPQLAIVPSG
jgi:MinD superfamily P-loop ATPase